MGPVGESSRTEPGQKTDREKGGRRELIDGVTFREFVDLAKKNGWTIDDLAREFRGGFGGSPGDPGFETSRHYFARIFDGDPSLKSVIVYRTVVEKYFRAVRYSTIGDHVRRCACSCGHPVWGRKQTATDACRQRLKRAQDRERAHGLLRNAKDQPANAEAFP